jgi:hypothetical protein
VQASGRAACGTHHLQDPGFVGTDEEVRRGLVVDDAEPAADPDADVDHGVSVRVERDLRERAGALGLGGGNLQAARHLLVGEHDEGDRPRGVTSPLFSGVVRGLRDGEQSDDEAVTGLDLGGRSELGALAGGEPESVHRDDEAGRPVVDSRGGRAVEPRSVASDLGGDDPEPEGERGVRRVRDDVHDLAPTARRERHLGDGRGEREPLGRVGDGADLAEPGERPVDLRGRPRSITVGIVLADGILLGENRRSERQHGAAHQQGGDGHPERHPRDDTGRGRLRGGRWPRRYPRATMSDREPTSAPRRSRTPLWVIEGLDIARLRAVPLRVVAGVVVVVGVVLAVALPDLVPPTPLVGAAVGLAALLLGLAVAVAIDAADLTVRGPRHVRAAGGELVAILPTDATTESAMPLAEAVLEAREEGSPRLLLGLAAAGRDARRCAAWTDALAVALARTGASVLRVDLASGRSERPGLVEVVREGRKLPDVVAFDPELRLARIGAGRDHAGALEVLPTLPTRLPRDLDVLLVSLPTAASRQVVGATSALEHVLVVAERDTTSRVDLIAGLDALEKGGIAAQVALLDDRTAARLTVASPADDDDAPAGVAGPAEIMVEPVAEEASPEPEPEPKSEVAEAGSEPQGRSSDALSAGAPAATLPADDPDATQQVRSPEAPADEPNATQLLDRADLEGPAEVEGRAPSEPESQPEPHPGSEVTPNDAAAVVPDDETVVAEAPASSAPATAAENAAVVGPEVDAQAENGPVVEPPAPEEPAAVASSEEPRQEEPSRPAVEPPDSGIRLRPVADTTPRRPSPDLQQPSVVARDVGVMEGAAAARAAAYAEAQAQAPDDSAGPRPDVARETRPEPDDRELPPDRREPEPWTEPRGRELPAEPHDREAPAQPQRPPAAFRAPVDLDVPDPIDVTEELPRIGGPGSRPSRTADEPDRDDLRTTAQLAILLDDLQAREDRP